MNKECPKSLGFSHLEESYLKLLITVDLKISTYLVELIHNTGYVQDQFKPGIKSAQDYLLTKK